MSSICPCEGQSPEERAISDAMIRQLRTLLRGKGGGGIVEVRKYRGKAPQIAVIHRAVTETIELTPQQRAML